MYWTENITKAAKKMKHVHIVKTVVFAFTVVMMVGVGCGSGQTKFITNGDFETGDLSGWDYYHGVLTEYGTQSSIVDEGDYAFKMTGSIDESSSAGFFWYNLSIPVVPDTEFSFAYYFPSKRVSYIGYRIFFNSEKNGYYFSLFSGWFVNSSTNYHVQYRNEAVNTWHSHTANVYDDYRGAFGSVPSDLRITHVAMLMNDPYRTGKIQTAYFDAIKLTSEEETPAPPTTPIPSPTRPPTPPTHTPVTTPTPQIISITPAPTTPTPPSTQVPTPVTTPTPQIISITPAPTTPPSTVITPEVTPTPTLTLVPTATHTPAVALIPKPTPEETPTPTPSPFASIQPIYIIGAAAVIAIILIAGVGISRKGKKVEYTKPQPPAEPPKTKAVKQEPAIEPAPTIPEPGIFIASAFGYKGATIVHKIKVENPTSEPVSDIKIHLFVPDVFLLKEQENNIALLKPKESKTVTFEIRPTGECGDCEVSGRVTYYDYATKKTKEVDIPAKTLSIVCPLLKLKTIDEDAWRLVVSELAKTEESTKEIDMPANTLFEVASDILRDMNMFMLHPTVTETPQLYRATARFYAEGVKQLKYAAQIEVVGGAKKSKLILKAWAEKEEALTGFYHGILDEIEKRVQVKSYIEDSIVQQFYHIGDRIGSVVKDNVMVRSTIGKVKNCPSCKREVSEDERFCPDCGAELK